MTPNKTIQNTMLKIGSALLFFVLASCAEKHPDIVARQKLMQNFGFAVDMLKHMREYPQNFDAEVAHEQAVLLKNDSDVIWSYFSEGSQGGKSNALIWQDTSAFLQKQDDFNQVIDALLTASKNAKSIDDIEPMINALTEECGSCHKIFKQ